MKNYTVFLIMGFIFFTSLLVKAQLSGTLGYSSYYNDNPQRTLIGQPEYVNSVISELGYGMFDEELSLNYSGNYNAYQNLSNNSYQVHSLLLSYDFNTTDKEENNFFTGLSYSVKLGQGELTAYDFSQTSAFINAKFPFNETFIFQAGFSSGLKSFPSLNNLYHFENIFSSKLSKFFNTGTGVFIESGIGMMNYSFTGESMAISNGTGSGRQSGRNSSNSEKTYSVIQIRSMFKISQSIFDNTGINFRFLYRKNLKDNRGMFSSADYIYSGDEELWDDPYGFSSNEIGVELTQKIPYGFTLKLNSELSRRHYTNNLADSLNLIQRIDERFGVWGGISKSFEEIPLLESLELSLEYLFVNNKSNTEIFNYKNNMLLFGVQVGF